MAVEQLDPRRIQRNIRAEIVTSVVVGMAVFGAITYFAVKSGVKPLAATAKAVK